MKQIVIAISALVFLAGCDNVFKGNMTLEKSIQIVTPLDRGDQRELDRCIKRNSRSSRCKRLYKKRDANIKVVEAGVHESKLTVSKKKVKLKFDRKTELEVKVPKATKLPTNNGSIELPAVDTGFIYDIKGKLRTEITQTDERSDVESCTWSEPRTVCRWYREPIPGCNMEVADQLNDRDPRRPRPRPRPPRNCHRRVKRCHTEYITYHGYQDVSFYNKYTDRFITFSMIKPESREMIGEFAGSNHASEKIYTYRSHCR